jgi:sialic acid synthase SpsE
VTAKTITIGSRTVGDGQPCFVIAEGGVNHNGDPRLAAELVHIAAQCQADAVKFQKRTASC